MYFEIYYFHSASTLFYDDNSDSIVYDLRPLHLCQRSRHRSPFVADFSAFIWMLNEWKHFQFIIIIIVWLNLTFLSHESPAPHVFNHVFSPWQRDFRSCSWKWKANKCDVGFWRTINPFNLQTTMFCAEGDVKRNKMVCLLNMHAPCAHSSNGYAKNTANDVSYAHRLAWLTECWICATKWRRHFQMNIRRQLSSEDMVGLERPLLVGSNFLWIFWVTRASTRTSHHTSHIAVSMIARISAACSLVCHSSTPAVAVPCPFCSTLAVIKLYMLNELVKVSAMAVLVLLLLLANFAIFFFHSSVPPVHTMCCVVAMQTTMAQTLHAIQQSSIILIK